MHNFEKWILLFCIIKFGKRVDSQWQKMDWGVSTVAEDANLKVMK